MKEELIKQYKIDKFYKYAERNAGHKVIEYGWVLTDNVDLPAVISYNSKSQSVTPEQAEWSKAEGVNATSLEDYKKYFYALTGKYAHEFLEEWSDKLDQFSTYWISHFKSGTEEQANFIIAVAKLIAEGKKFSMLGRVYKIIDSEK